MVIIEPNLKAPQSMYQTNLFKCNPPSKSYSKKQSLLQVSVMLHSGAVCHLIYKISTELRRNFDVTKFKIAQCASHLQQMSS